MTDVIEWMKANEHLPGFMRKFDDQKDVFQTIEQRLGAGNDDTLSVGWMAAHCYVIDRFLRFCALHGYTLQQSRAHVTFYDIEDTLTDAQRDRELDALDEKNPQPNRMPPVVHQRVSGPTPDGPDNVNPAQDAIQNDTCRIDS